MNLLGATGYGAAALAFLVLTALLTTSWEGRQVGARLIVASAVTAVWGFVLAAESGVGGTPLPLVYLAEVARAATWLLVLIDLAAAAAPRILIVGAHALWLGLLVIGLAAQVLLQLGVDIDAQPLLSRAVPGLALMGLILFQQIYRNSTQSGRRALRYFVVGLGGMFVYDLFLFSQMELASGISAHAWNARGFVNGFAVPMIALAVRNNPQWSLNIFVSRQAVFYAMALAAVGIYLVAMALGGFVVRDLGGSWGDVGEILFFACAALVLAGLVTSRALRRQAAVFISKHFYSNKYDYRIEWLRFIQTLSSTSEDDIRRTSVRAVAQIFSSPGGILFLPDEQGRQFVPATGWPVRVDTVTGIAPVSVNSELVRFVHEKQWIIDLHEYRRTPDLYQNIELPEWLGANPTLRIVSPILELDRLAGFLVLYDPPPPFQLTYEDRDLLKTVGRHVATQLAQRDAHRKLAESRQFEAYNRLTAFMMHDLKNSVAQLQLIVANAERHKRKPEFVEDTVGTIANTVDRMNRLIDQIHNTPTSARTQVIRLDELVANAVARCGLRQPVPLLHREEGRSIWIKADAERLSAVLEHVIRNAQDATPEGQVSVRVTEADGEAVIAVTDNGQGMDPEFVRERLFRPFDSTKGFKGMGIGAYQTREYVQILGGHVDVQSTPGKGTSFSITLPAERSTTPGRPLARHEAGKRPIS
jgi:putative PEP-CTERM system histidine kinase